MIEIWQNIKGYEGKYQISNKGRIKSLIFSNRQAKFMREKILKPQFNSNYYQVSFIKIWGHAGLIEKKLNINANNIRECCRGKRESAGGYKWKYV